MSRSPEGATPSEPEDGRSGPIFGFNSVLSALDQHPEAVHRLAVQRGRRDGRMNEVVRRAKQEGIPVSTVERSTLDRLTDGASHQGVAAWLAAVSYADLDQVLARPEDDRQVRLLVALDGVVDPQNLGAIARSAEAAGADALIVPRHGSASPGAGAFKASAGALSRIPLCRVANLARALRKLKERGFWVVGTAPAEGKPPWELDLNDPLVIVIGGEEKGLRPNVARACDFLVTVPTPGRTESLNASVATGMILYEILRQRSAG